jgi:hypothetical protein
METHADAPRHDLRRQDRRLCDHNVTVLWRGPLGEDKFVNTKVLDICEFGVRLQMPEALPKHAYLRLSASKLGLMGDGSVRHCTRIRGSKFAVGIEFTAGLRWSPKS